MNKVYLTTMHDFIHDAMKTKRGKIASGSIWPVAICSAVSVGEATHNREEYKEARKIYFRL